MANQLKEINEIVLEARQAMATQIAAKHLPGRHNQASHGRGGGGGRTSGGGGGSGRGSLAQAMSKAVGKYGKPINQGVAVTVKTESQSKAASKAQQDYLRKNGWQRVNAFPSRKDYKDGSWRKESQFRHPSTPGFLAKHSEIYDKQGGSYEVRTLFGV